MSTYCQKLAKAVQSGIWVWIPTYNGCTSSVPMKRVSHTEKMSPVYICQNDKPMTSLALSTAHQVKTNLCQPHSLKSCHIFGIDLSETCHPQYLFFAVDGSQVPI